MSKKGAESLDPIRTSDGSLLWAMEPDECKIIADAVVPFGKYIPIGVPENSTEIAKDMKNLADALVKVVGMKLYLRELIVAANRPVQSNNGTQFVPSVETQSEPATVVNIGGNGQGYDVSKDRKASLFG